jgi:general secretion pathway protein F
MPSFAYTARDRAGKATSATLEAPSRKDALRMLAARGLQVAGIAEAAGPKAEPRKGEGRKNGGRRAEAENAGPGGKDRPKRADRLPLLEGLLDLTTSGLSAGEAVRLLATRIKEPRLRALCAGLWERISEGAPLSRSMAEFPEVFDSGTVNLIQAGEATGSLNDTLARIITHQTEQKELRRQMFTALAYPVFMVFVATGVILFFLFFLLPRLKTLLDSLGGKLPFSTQLLVGVSGAALHYGLFVVLAAALAGVSLWRWYGTDAGRRATDAWLLKLPLIGPFLVSQTVLSFSQTLSVLLENGITAAEALRMTERQITNRVHQQAFNLATARVLEGESLSLALTRTHCFPDLVLDRLAVGENTGSVVPSLKAIAVTYRKKIGGQLEIFTKVLATGVLMGVFLFVGFIAFAMVSAIFSVSASFQM